MQAEAIIALGKIGSPAVEPLIAALADDYCYVRWNALWALGETGDIRAVGPLIRAMGHADSSFRRDVGLALAKITGEKFDIREPDWRKWWEEGGTISTGPGRSSEPK